MDDNTLNVIILHYKTINKTEECIDSLLKLPEDVHIIVVDNFSNDGTLETLKNKYLSSGIEFIEMNCNVGFARANNWAMKLLVQRGEKYAVLTNNDIQFLDNSVAELIRALKENDTAVIAAPRVYDLKYEITSSVQPIRNKGIDYFFHMLFPTKEDNFAAKCNSETFVQTFSGCCFACNLKLMEAIGYMDEYTFLYFEESILAAKANKNFYSIIYVPTAGVVHAHAATTKSINNQIYYYLLDSEVYYLVNYLKIRRIFLIMYISLKRLLHKYKYKSIKLDNQEKEILNKLKRGKYEKS